MSAYGRAEAGLITIHINGESQQAPDSQTVEELLKSFKMPLDRIAVECNLEILPRDRWAHVRVQDGDRLEVVHFVGGGARDGGSRLPV
jgi:thiamine biosynthesis protein ThiS